MTTKFEQLKNILVELTHISSATALLHWDLETYMPERGAEMRGKTISVMSALCHEKFTSPEFEKLITELNDAMKKWGQAQIPSEIEPDPIFSEEMACVVREVWRDFSRQKKLPKAFVAELAQVTSDAHAPWVRARATSDFSIFSPTLKKIIELKRQEAEYYGYEESPYNALLDGFEPDATIADYEPMFEEVKKFLVPFIACIKEQYAGVADPSSLGGTRDDITSLGMTHGDFDPMAQEMFCKEMLARMGFPFDRGRLDQTAHPFTQGFHAGDVRITTRYDRDNVFFSIGSSIHEAGHAFYDLGLSAEHFGTPLGESLSLGIHESQSRLWENHVGKSRAFWTPLYPRLQSAFPKPFADISFEQFYRHLNRVEPSLIRTEADEVTYNLHIIIRYEIEREIIEGAIAIDDIPEVWNQKVKHYLGIDVPDDAHGCLQDVHWSCGYFGYFPTYCLGNLYAAQLYAAAQRDILNLEEEITQGSFDHLREWLRTRIHVHGRRYVQDALILRATGEKLNARHFIDYITKKYSEIQ
ncbi:carboxypeptidase M32 [Candidatus Uhrbacteria bacterium]|nr:carboxypeptidase M32 [Candidatus Uhrbacteria bacterium]